MVINEATLVVIHARRKHDTDCSTPKEWNLMKVHKVNPQVS